jgi:hypothetical protein
MTLIFNVILGGPVKKLCLFVSLLLHATSIVCLDLPKPIKNTVEKTKQVVKKSLNFAAENPRIVVGIATVCCAALYMAYAHSQCGYSSVGSAGWEQPMHGKWFGFSWQSYDQEPWPGTVMWPITARNYANLSQVAQDCSEKSVNFSFQDFKFGTEPEVTQVAHSVLTQALNLKQDNINFYFCTDAQKQAYEFFKPVFYALRDQVFVPGHFGN